jgi:hypothetical protein
MSRKAPAKILHPAHEKALARAVERLEFEGLAATIGNYAGQPAQKILARLPGPVVASFNFAIEKAVLKALDVAIHSLDPEGRKPPKTVMAAVFTGLTGALSGAVGLVGLPVELPVTTMLILRSIASIARHMGEDLTTLEARLACVEVFAFGGYGLDKGKAEAGYYASRALLGKLASDVSTVLVERSAASAAASVTAAPAVAAFAGEVTTRFSATVWERAAASAAPVIGALGGASLNVIFTNHFNSVAWGHFTVRRLERIYGEDLVRKHYARLSAERRLAAPKKS